MVARRAIATGKSDRTTRQNVEQIGKPRKARRIVTDEERSMERIMDGPGDLEIVHDPNGAHKPGDRIGEIPAKRGKPQAAPTK